MQIEEAQHFAQEHGMTLFETSAKDNVNVVESFMHLVKAIKRMKLGGGDDDDDDDWEVVERADVIDIDQKKNINDDESWCA